MHDLVWLIPAFPAAGFVIILFLGRRMGEPLAGWFATLMCGAAFIVTLGVFAKLLSLDGEQRAIDKVIFTWIPVGALDVNVGFLADPLSITMALFVTGVGTLIHLYAIGYMHGDPKFSKFFLYMNLFAFSMLMLVLGDNLLITFVGWEGVGVCSYFLISFWQTRMSAAIAGKKAFVTNRIGDWGFMIAMFLAFQAVGTLNYRELNGAAGTIAHTTVVAIVLLLFVGAVGKSAQLPLYIWLPDAMEGPTPVSALIHAATMVTAGVYLMCRVSPLLHEAPGAGTLIAIVGAATALFAATIAVGQADIKRVLAYSTISQLGYMFLAVGSGAYTAAVFHMVTHAFFKALLFLGAGSVIHGMHAEQDMRRMGALRKFLPITSGTFIIAWLAIAGVPPFAGFWSKDDILLAAWDKSPILWLVGFVTALLTAYYMTRQVILVFFGKPRWKEARPDGYEVHPHESPVLMVAPLVVLAALATVAGALNLPFNRHTELLGRWLAPVVETAERHLPGSTTDLRWPLAAAAVVLALVGIGVAWLVYERQRVKAIEPEVLAHAWYVDEGVSWFVGHPGRAAFEDTAWADKNVVDGAVNGTAGLVHITAEKLRRLQSGYVRQYALGFALGVVLLLAWFVSRGLV